MSLRLVVDNTKQSYKKTETCRTSCAFFDEITESCGIYDGIDLDHHGTIMRCQDFVDKQLISESTEKTRTFELIENDFTAKLDEEDFLFGFQGEKYDFENSTYPLQPDLPPGRDDVIWYVSEDKTYGCWVLNNYKNRLMTIPKNGEVERGWVERVYKSPYPLHNHNSSVSISSRMCWLVNEKGYGQYVLLVNGKVKMLQYDEPEDWKND